MPSIRLAEVARNAASNAVVDLLDSGGSGNPGKLLIYSGSRPATPNTAIGGGNTLLATLTFSFPAFGAAGTAGGNSTGVAAASAITSGTAAASGTAAWFRITDNAGVVIMDGLIKETGEVGDAAMVMDETAVIVGGTVSISAFNYNTAMTCS